MKISFKSVVFVWSLLLAMGLLFMSVTLSGQNDSIVVEFNKEYLSTYPQQQTTISKKMLETHHIGYITTKNRGYITTENRLKSNWIITVDSARTDSFKLNAKVFFSDDNINFYKTKKPGFFQSLKPTKYDYISLGLATLDGISRGLENAYHANPHVFEQRFGAYEYGFFGSEAWQRNYVTERQFNSEGQFNKHKTEVFGNFGRDIKHTSDDVSKWSGRLAGGTFAVGAYLDIHSKGKKKSAIIVKGVLIWLTSSLAERTVYNFVSR